MSSDRYALVAIAPENAFDFPAYLLPRVWQDRLQPLKQKLTERFGGNLFSINLRQTLHSPTERDFEEIVQASGLSPPLNNKIRLLISDEPISRFPDGKDTSHIIVAIELGRKQPHWSAASLAPQYTLIECSSKSFMSIVADILCDFSYSNSFAINQEIRTISNHLGSLENFSAKKAGTNQIFNNAPYGSFSFLTRKDRTFGTDDHVKTFIKTWDKFLVNELKQADPSRVSARLISKNYPGFRNQLSPKRVDAAIDRLPVGTHILFVQRRSTEARTTPSFRNSVRSTFDQLDFIGGGRRLFGFFSNREMPQVASDLVRKGIAYAVRLHIGG